MEDYDEIPELVPYETPADIGSEEDEDFENPSEEGNHDVDTGLTVEEFHRPRRVTPLTLLTGWLGSGKTTFLHHMLDEFSNAGKTVAILQNETSELMGVERALKIQDDSGIFGEVLELKNGCICCSVRSNFLVAVDALLEKRDFDYVLVECSGIADPGKLAGLFWVDDDLESRVYLDGVISVVDASLLPVHLKRAQDHSDVIIAQIAYADKVLLNKTDLVNDEELQNLEASIRSFNGNAPIIRSFRSQVPIDDVLFLRSLRLGKSLQQTVQRVIAEHSDKVSTHHEHDHTCSQECHHSSSTSASASTSTSTSTSTVVADCVVDGIEVFSSKPVHAVSASEGKDHVSHGISTFVFSYKSPSVSSAKEIDPSKPYHGFALQKLKLWLTKLLHDESQEIYDMELMDMMKVTDMNIFRMKAVIAIEGKASRYYLQAVQSTYSLDTADENVKIDGKIVVEEDIWNEIEPRESRLIVIGTNLDHVRLAKGFAACLEVEHQ